MKKLISVLLAVLMLSALCIPAFAAVDKAYITDVASLDNAQARVYTNTEDAEWYSIEIPADKEIAWATTDPVDMSYGVASQLEKGKQITVTVSCTANNLTDTEGGDDTIAFTPAGFAAQTYGEVNGTGTKEGAKTYTTATTPVTLTIAEEAWHGIAISVYEVNLTYTVAVA